MYILDDLITIQGTRTDQWFGSVVRSSGKGGYVVVSFIGTLDILVNITTESIPLLVDYVQESICQLSCYTLSDIKFFKQRFTEINCIYLTIS